MALDMNAILAMAAKKNAEDKNKFHPIDLTEGNVQAIFDRCLATKEEIDVYRYFTFQILKPTLTQKSSEVYRFSEEKIKKNEKSIGYLFGQIKNIHENNSHSIIGLQEGFLRYDETIWTKDYDTLFKLYALAQASNYLLDFSSLPEKPDLITAYRASNMKPTLSPKDPAFPAWWEAHRAEWED